MVQGFLPGLHEIEGYGRGGFRFGGMSHQGSLLLLPSGIHAWGVLRAQALTIADFDAVLAERDTFDFLVLGAGMTALSPASPVALALRDAGLRIESMDTPAAARTFNVLFAEKRRIAAALIAVS